MEAVAKLRRARLVPAALLVLIAMLVAGPGAASAAVTLGPTDTAAPPDGLTGCGLDACTFVNAAGPGSTFAAPFDGVLVRWRIQTATVVSQWQLRVVREVTPGFWTANGTGPLETAAPGAERTFEARLPIAAGELVAVNGPGPSASGPLGYRSVAGGTNRRWNPPLADGSAPRASNAAGAGFIGLYNADLEPDADGDGYGDETQDCDPANAAKTTDCAPPDAQIVKGPKPKTKKKRATFEFTGSDGRAVAGFECSLDGAAFASCSPPLTVKVKKGKHSFSVRAIDASGNVDASPATYAWKVKKKRKKK